MDEENESDTAIEVGGRTSDEPEAPEVPEAPEEPEAPQEPEVPQETEPQKPVDTSSSEKKKKIQINSMGSLKHSDDHYLTTPPAVPEQAKPYSPILYTFRVKSKGKNSLFNHITTKPPPLYLQFDHAIAVIWTLFNKQSNRDKLGIVQLQWALHFLNSIYNNEGVHPKDIQLCIDTIQDYLIDEYADMSEESVVYGTKTPSRVEEEQPKNVPFSINYSQMIDKCPLTSTLDTTESEIIDKQLLEELENVKKVVGIDSIDLTQVVSKDQVMNILNDWKKEQIEKIQQELKMLYVVEDMMKNSDSQNFDGYTDEKQFETIFKRNYEKPV